MTFAPLSSYLLISFPEWFCLIWSIIFILIPFFPVYFAIFIQIKFSDDLKIILESKIYLFLLSCVLVLYFFLLEEIIGSAAISLFIFLLFPLIEYYFTDSERLFKAMSDENYEPNEEAENNNEKNKNNDKNFWKKNYYVINLFY